jgi:hypothetical protein
MSKKPFKNFNNPKQHLGGVGHYVAPKARSEAEKARRHAELPRGAGALTAEHEQHGLEFSKVFFEKVKEAPAVHYVTGVLAVSAFNSSWYGYARYAKERMSRIQKLTEVVNEETDERLTRAELREQITYGFDVATGLHLPVVADRRAGRQNKRNTVTYSRFVGDLALKLSAMHHNVTEAAGNAYEVSVQVRDAALLTVEEARSMGSVIGSHPTLAQWANPDSPLAVDVRVNGPDEAVEAYHETAKQVGFAPN